MSPTTIAALIALGGVVLSAIVSFVIAHLKLSTEHRLDIASYRAIRKLLEMPDWKLRSFEAIKRHLRGFEDSELRKLLVAAGAVAFYSKSRDEYWGLLKRNVEKLEPRQTGPEGDKLWLPEMIAVTVELDDDSDDHMPRMM
jgi:hypothetical protein